MKNRAFTLNKLLRSNRFVFCLSVLFALVIWVVVMIQFSVEEDKLIPDVKITIEQSNNLKSMGLENFSGDSFTVDVTVHGKRYVLASIDKEDIVVTARTNYVATADTHTLRLESTVLDKDSNVNITGLSRDSIRVYFDVPTNRELELSTKVVVADGKNIAADGYIVDYERLSTSTVTISGPELAVNRVSKAVAIAYLDQPIRETKLADTEINFYDSNGEQQRSYITVADDLHVTMTIPVYKRVKMPLTVQFKNAPAKYESEPLPMVFTPEQAEFGISEDKLETLQKVSIGTIDFAQIPAGTTKTFNFNTSDLTDLKLLESRKQFRVQINTEGMSSRYLPVLNNNIVMQNRDAAMQNMPKGTEITITQGIDEVRAIGPSASVAELEEGDIFADVDLNVNTLQAKTGSYEIPARLYVKGHDDCWVYGNFTVELTVTVP